ncbi:TPA: VirB3 family type IV secretion system protein [Burkholderia vietnamiensis]|nr:MULTISPECIES: VirB3 family type IV secretion system protein [Burkholderia]MBE0628561.1 VirB3 family type IV secretion system protein [Burkholderia vietnamiensis]MBR7912118.1 VirB3 family type IV secretion system protein [Burkholderia vietnamiensis]MBR7917075.1 VirB3 family type IV secretion system protein [Burkholderia vietnamiensis]MBR7974477.1 VirB3 family type IV secretion system protein [Burkholderia vietnamiensis]MBR8001805.1 VirB3 family type IV secretion system protein [Burkholderia 
MRNPTRVSRSLSLPRQMGGADRGLAIANGTLTALLCYSSMTPTFLVVGIAVHWLLRWLSTRDPWWKEVLVVYNRFPDVHEPLPTSRFSVRFKRPYGFDQDLPC